jgi:hypothetical protein
VRAIPVGEFDEDRHDDFALPDGTEFTTGDLPDGYPSDLYRGLGVGRFEKLDTGIGVKTVHGVGQGVPSQDGFALALKTPWQRFDVSPNMMNVLSLEAGAPATRQIRFDDPILAPFDADAGSDCYTVAIDADDDGRKNLVMLSRYVHGEHTVWRNQGGGQFEVAHTVPAWVDGLYQAESTSVADLDGDGKDDFVALHIDRRTAAANGRSSLRVDMNDRAGSFVDRTGDWLGAAFQDSDLGFYELLQADVNDDGRPDLVFTVSVGGAGPGSTVQASLVLLVNRGGRAFREGGLRAGALATAALRRGAVDAWKPGPLRGGGATDVPLQQGWAALLDPLSFGGDPVEQPGEATGKGRVVRVTSRGVWLAVAARGLVRGEAEGEDDEDRERLVREVGWKPRAAQELVHDLAELLRVRPGAWAREEHGDELFVCDEEATGREQDLAQSAPPVGGHGGQDLLQQVVQHGVEEGLLVVEVAVHGIGRDPEFSGQLAQAEPAHPMPPDDLPGRVEHLVPVEPGPFARTPPPHTGQRTIITVQCPV